MSTKYIFITGGVVSGLGKGITAASLSRLLKMRGLKVAAQKFDPYMNVDPGTMNPYQHGEVFVTEDGAETDLDLGHYERFIDENLTKFSNLTAGKVYWNVLNKEREGEYLGETVQVIPHVTKEIQDFLFASAEASQADVVITEIGGTTGDIESQPFLEAIRQISFVVGRENCLFIHVTLVPFLKCSNEHKSKPTQHSVKGLQSFGISPNIIITRSDEPINDGIKDKIALFCNVKRDCVIENITLPCLYEVLLMLHKNNLDGIVCRELNLATKEPDLTEWEKMLTRIRTRNKTVRIAIVGKYVKLHDAYLSVIEALSHGGYECGSTIDIKWVDSERITDRTVYDILHDCSGILIPGGFGDRGIEGMITACKFARENNIPYLGLCLGMQISVIEFARNVCGFKDANSREFCPGSKNLVIDLMPDQQGVIPLGGTMRLGSYPCKVHADSLLARSYKKPLIHERHRHRYEFNNNYRDLMESNGMLVSGTSPDNHIVETIELPENNYFIGVQFHPEFKSRPNRAHPLFLSFVQASLQKQQEQEQCEIIK